jgi:hypothetical protein
MLAVLRIYHIQSNIPIMDSEGRSVHFRNELTSLVAPQIPFNNFMTKRSGDQRMIPLAR